RPSWAGRMGSRCFSRSSAASSRTAPSSRAERAHPARRASRVTGPEPAATVDLARELGLTSDEYDRIIAALGREPTYTELGLFSALWSEHCAYKHSRIFLRRLPQTGPHVLQGPGENAGALDIGDGWAVVFKIESHNHPSFIEPFQGAATGVGGILQDIFTPGSPPHPPPGLAPFRRPRRSADSPADRRRRLRHQLVRQLLRLSDRGRRDGVRPGLRREPARQRNVRGTGAGRSHLPGPCGWRR